MPGNKKNKRKPKNKTTAPASEQPFQSQKGFDPKGIKGPKGGTPGNSFSPKMQRTTGSQRGR